MKFSPQVQLITEQDQDWSVPRNNMVSEPIYTTHREARHAPLPTADLQLPLAYSVCLLLCVSLLYIISVAQVVHGAESH